MRTARTALSVVALATLIAGACFNRASTQQSPLGSAKSLLTTTTSSQQLPDSFLGGVIEGYYGEPWSTQDTVHMIQFIGAHHMNTFVYAPKDDRYQRDKWNVLYPAQQLADIKTLVDACHKYNVQFVYSISPGSTITYGNDKDRADLVAKINQVRSIGVDVFMLSLDDVYHGLEGTDWNQYHGNMAWAQSSLANHLIQVESSLDSKFRLVMTPTTYHGMDDNAYWDSLRVHLNKSVPVIWTGPGPGALSAEITAADVKTVEKFIGHPIIIWDNYPVNDYTYTQSKRPELFMGPVIGRSADLVSAVAGYLFNPMIQARPSELALWTGGDYLFNPTQYNPQLSWTKAIHALGGNAWPAFQTFVEYSSAYYRDTNPPQQLVQDMQDFWQLPSSANLLKSALYQDWLSMSQVDTSLRHGLPDKALYDEIQPWTSLLSRQGQAGLLAVSMLEAERTGKPTADLKQQLQQRITQLKGNSNFIAGDAAISFAEKALQQ